MWLRTRALSIVLCCAAMAFGAEKPELKGTPKNAVAVPLVRVSFDKNPVGNPPAGFTFAAMGDGSAFHWEIQQDPQIPTLHHLFVQTGQAESGDNVALALFN